MKKIGFVVTAFGAAKGGEYVHCRMIAEHLRPYYNIEILTSTQSDTPEEYPEGTYQDNGMTIRRFRNLPIDETHHRIHIRQAKPMRRLRYYLGRLGLLQSITSAHPIWKAGQKADKRLFMSQYSFKPGLLEYISEHGREYDVLIFFNMYDSSTALGATIVPEKSILIPLAHPTRTLYMPLFSSLFTRVRHIAFNTEAERRMCRRIFGRHMAPDSVVGTGIELDPPAEWEQVKTKYGLPDKYVLYLGRITKKKIGNIIPEFLKYRDTMDPDAKLVLTGQITKGFHCPNDPSVILTGYIDSRDKSALIRNAAVMVNPSVNESLSLLMLEAMASGIPCLVNGKSEVMRDHCEASGAALYYDSSKDFREKLYRMMNDTAFARELGKRGPAYVNNHYDWETITDKLRNIIEGIDKADAPNSAPIG